MSKKNTKRKQQDTNPKPSVTKAGGSVVSGNVTIKNGEFVGRDRVVIQTTTTSTQTLFQPIYGAIAARPNSSDEERADIQAEVKEVESEVAKGDKADENFLLRRLRNLKRMAPDILELALALIASPAAGLGLLAAKITKRMAEDAGPR